MGSIGPTVAAVTFLLLAGCSSPEGEGEAESQSAAGVHLMLMFQDREEGTEPYGTRMLITDRFVRMDDGYAGSNFVLFNRAEERIYSVTHGNRSILVIRKKPVLDESPIPIQLDAEKAKHPDAPEVDGKRPVEYSLLVNDETCSQVIAVPGLLREGVVAMREFRRTLAGQHAENLPKTPKEMLDPCFVAYHIYAPVQHLQYGFPIQQWDEGGTTRSLVDYDRDFDMDPKLFELPEDYRRTGIGPGGVGTSAKGGGPGQASGV